MYLGTFLGVRKSVFVYSRQYRRGSYDRVGRRRPCASGDIYKNRAKRGRRIFVITMIKEISVNFCFFTTASRVGAITLDRGKLLYDVDGQNNQFVHTYTVCLINSWID